MKLIEQIDIQPQTTKWLYDLDKNGLLEVDHSFQRKYVWTAKHQVKLIESILMGYPIPEIYLWNIGTDEDSGDTKYSIIDGQQRCGAAFKFIANNYKLKEIHLNKDNPNFEQIKNKHFKELGSEDKKAIWSYLFSIRLVRSQVKRRSIVEMFLRLNSNNMTLNPQELRNAEFEGEFMKLSAELAELQFWEKNKLFGLADRRRMSDVSFISTLLVFMKKGIEEDINSKNLNQIYDLYNDEYQEKQNDETEFKKVISEIDRVIDSKKNRIKVLKRQVHFYTLFTVTYDFIKSSDTLNDKQIANYRKFIDLYENEDELLQYFDTLVSEIYSYKSMVKEGTRQKGNRFKRHLNVKKIMNSNSA